MAAGQISCAIFLILGLFRPTGMSIAMTSKRTSGKKLLQKDMSV